MSHHQNFLNHLATQVRNPAAGIPLEHPGLVEGGFKIPLNTNYSDSMKKLISLTRPNFKLILSDFILLHPPEPLLKQGLSLPALYYHKLFVIALEHLEISAHFQGFITFPKLLLSKPVFLTLAFSLEANFLRELKKICSVFSSWSSACIAVQSPGDVFNAELCFLFCFTRNSSTEDK